MSSSGLGLEIRKAMRWLFQSLMAFLRRVYAIAVTPSRPWIVRTLCMTFVAVFLCLRCAALMQGILKRKLLLVLLVAAWITVGVANLAVASLIALFVGVAIHPEDGIGHRVGAEGYDGEHFENTIDALRNLACRDSSGEFDDPGTSFPFYECDVQETKDRHLVVFHDPNLARAFPNVGPNIKAFSRLRSEGIEPSTCSIADLTFSQLSLLHLGGRDGQHVPSLKEFLSACSAFAIRRSLAIEVKSLQTDYARQELINVISSYKISRNQVTAGTSVGPTELYSPFEWVAIIAFPQYFASAFGEFGSERWRHWAKKMKVARINARCCHIHWLDFTFGA